LIRIKGITYEIIEFGDHEFHAGDIPEPPGKNLPLGLIDQVNSRIYLYSGVATDVLEETFLHEVVHAVTLNESKMTEDMVGRISADLYAVLKANGMLSEGWMENLIDKTEEDGEVDDIDSIRELDRTEKESLAR
jgi:hypothetical protein